MGRLPFSIFKRQSLPSRIVLTSQTIGTIDGGFEVHGIFPSFAAAAKHVIKDSNFGEHKSNLILTQWDESEDKKEFSDYQLGDVDIHWCASIQPIRNEDGL